MGSLLRTPGAMPAWKALVFLFNIVSAAVAKRHVVYWNSTNTRLTEGDLSIQVNLNDYLDIYCPYYPNKDTLGLSSPEILALYLVGETSFQGCVETTGAIKRWECNTPHATFGPVRFSEKIQRFTPFSLGFEFLPGRHYYYSSLPTDEGPPLPCMKLRVTVCCEPKSIPCDYKVVLRVVALSWAASHCSEGQCCDNEDPSASEGSKQIKATVPRSSACTLRTAPPPLILVLLLLLLLTT